MKKFAEGTNETEKLTDAIRKLGIPYVSEEPDSVYWANFRVRVMDRIAEDESKSSLAWPERIREFIASHVLGTSVSAATLALVIALAVIVNPFSAQEPQIAATSKPVAANSKPVAANSKSVATVQSTPAQMAQVTEPTTSANSSALKGTALPATHSIAKKSEAKPKEDLALLDDKERVSITDLPELYTTDADNSVSLDELSQPQLESLLKSMDDTE